jgi:DNA/RNA-binding domain of Phe-tRNA-synthetase-like protein
MAIIEVDEQIQGLILLGVLQAGGLQPTGPCPVLDQDLEALVERLNVTFAEPAQAGTLFRPARELYRSIGIDPTRRRPSSEALIRRAIKGSPLYRINRVVDACNLCSMEFALPIGLYDTAEVRWPARLRLGRAGEGYKGLGKEYVNVSGRWTLADRDGPFGNPSSDSFRTRIRDESQACTFVIYAPASYGRERLQEQLETAAASLQRYANAHALRQEIA